MSLCKISASGTLANMELAFFSLEINGIESYPDSELIKSACANDLAFPYNDIGKFWSNVCLGCVLPQKVLSFAVEVDQLEVGFRSVPGFFSEVENLCYCHQMLIYRLKPSHMDMAANLLLTLRGIFVVRGQLQDAVVESGVPCD